MASDSRTTSDLLRLDNQLCFSIYAASRAITRAYRPILDPLGLTYPQYLVLLVLWEQDGPSVGDLGNRLYLDSGTLTPLLKRMEQNGYVIRKRAPDDERRVEVFLGPAGEALRGKAIEIPEALIANNHLDESQVAQTKVYVDLILNKIHECED